MFDVDIVYFWCDGRDGEFARKRSSEAKRLGVSGIENCDAGYVQNGELEYSVRSVRRHMPWVRNIFVVTDGQDPKIQGIRLVDHSDLLDESQIPCFNPYLLESKAPLIRGLSEHFIFANDDTFVRKDVGKDFFFREGVPIARFRDCERDNVCVYQTALDASYDAFNRKFGTQYETLWPHHNMDGYLRSSAESCLSEFSDEYDSISNDRFRKNGSIHRVVWSLFDITFKNGVKKIVNRSGNSIDSLYITNNRKDIFDELTRLDPALFCVNDTRFSTDEDRKRAMDDIVRIFV